MNKRVIFPKNVMDMKCTCTTCPIHNYFNYVINRYHRGHQVTVLERYDCGCCRIHAVGRDIYDGSETTDYKCPSCKNYPKAVEAKKKEIKKNLDREFSDEVKSLLDRKRQVSVNSDEYMSICSEIGRIKGKYEALRNQAFAHIDIPRPERRLI